MLVQIFQEGSFYGTWKYNKTLLLFSYEKCPGMLNVTPQNSSHTGTRRYTKDNFGIPHLTTYVFCLPYMLYYKCVIHLHILFYQVLVEIFQDVHVYRWLFEFVEKCQNMPRLAVQTVVAMVTYKTLEEFHHAISPQILALSSSVTCLSVLIQVWPAECIHDLERYEVKVIGNHKGKM